MNQPLADIAAQAVFIIAGIAAILSLADSAKAIIRIIKGE